LKRRVTVQEADQHLAPLRRGLFLSAIGRTYFRDEIEGVRAVLPLAALLP
jgi:hypothetical protein